MSAAQRVVLVDDEPDLQELLVFNLGAAGFRVEAVATGTAGIAATRRERPTVVILDLMLPDVSGAEVCRRLRFEEMLDDVGILMLTARSDEYDRVLGFEVGADDYVVKPYSVREMVLRVRALAWRATEMRAGQRALEARASYVWRALSLDPAERSVLAGNLELALRPLEYKLLELFLKHPGVLFSNADLLAQVWGLPPDTSTRTVGTHIGRLRERLGSHGEAIETVPGFGYRLRDP